MSETRQSPGQDTPHPWTAEEETLVAQLLRETLLGQANARAEGWKSFAWVLLVGLIVAGIGNVYQGTQHRWIIRYVEVDKASQTARIIEPAAERYEPSVSIVQGALAKAIQTLRAVGTDSEYMQQAWADLRVCTTRPKGAAQLKEYEIREHPLMPRPPRKVEIIRNFPQTKRTYDLRWVEYQYSEKRELVSTQTYGGTFTFVRRDPVNDAELNACIGGIFLDFWAWGKDQ